MDKEQWKAAQEAANSNPAIPANPASSQVAKLMYDMQARVAESGGVVETPETKQAEPVQSGEQGEGEQQEPLEPEQPVEPAESVESVEPVEPIDEHQEPA